MLKQRLDQKIVQKLYLAPALQQAIRLLPLTNLELIEIIDQEMSQNPMIELEEDQAPPKDEREDGEVSDQAEMFGDKDSVDDEAFDVGAFFREYLDEGFRPDFQEDRERVSLENTLARNPSLWDHLNWQASLAFDDPRDLEIARFIIGNIKENGYLAEPVEELAELIRTAPEALNAVRKRILMFDPVGSAGLDLKEVLLAQMDHLDIDDPTARTIVTEHLSLLEKSDYLQLAKVLNLTTGDIKAHLDLIRSLDPAPGLKYAQERAVSVVPDILVVKEGDDLKIHLNDEGLPRLRLSRFYNAMLSRAGDGDPETLLFLKDKMKKALWFLRSLDQRNRTIAKVAKYIVDKQKDFFDRGVDSIKPLTLMEIAQEIGVHESTVGRVVANKQMSTPLGTFPLKYFFHKSLQGSYGEDVSSLKVKDRIRKIVGSEDKSRPLSDIEIGDILTRENLRVARRTVAKYRKQLKIPPSHIRKRKSYMEG
jgi:RNA polymerase sigma-54 factor